MLWNCSLGFDRISGFRHNESDAIAGRHALLVLAVLEGDGVTSFQHSHGQAGELVVPLAIERPVEE